MSQNWILIVKSMNKIVNQVKVWSIKCMFLNPSEWCSLWVGRWVKGSFSWSEFWVELQTELPMTRVVRGYIVHCVTVHDDGPILLSNSDLCNKWWALVVTWVDLRSVACRLARPCIINELMFLMGDFNTMILDLDVTILY